MKNKILTVALVVALIAIMVSGTLAYFTDSDKVTNTFTVGSVYIEIFENNEETESDCIEFVDPLIPVAEKVPAEDDNYIQKVVKVKNTGANSAYVRTHLAVPAALAEYLVLDVDNGSGWVQTSVSEGVKDGIAYKVYTYDYSDPVDPDTFTAELLKGVYLASDVDLKDNPATPSGDLEFCKPDGKGSYVFSGFVAHKKVSGGYTSNTVNVLVASEAIQTVGFDNGATDALDSGFGQGKNPWQ